MKNQVFSKCLFFLWLALSEKDRHVQTCGCTLLEPPCCSNVAPPQKHSVAAVVIWGGQAPAFRVYFVCFGGGGSTEKMINTSQGMRGTTSTWLCPWCRSFGHDWSAGEWVSSAGCRHQLLCIAWPLGRDHSWKQVVAVKNVQQGSFGGYSRYSVKHQLRSGHPENKNKLKA